MAKVFKFQEKRYQSYELSAWVKWFLEGYDYIQQVEDVQDEKESYYLGDFRVTENDGNTYYCEVKCEAGYTTLSSPNLAIERYSDFDKKKDGGPWSNSALYWIHIYKDKWIVIMEREELAAWMDKQILKTEDELKMMGIRIAWAQNPGYRTQCYIVPRETLKKYLSSYLELEIDEELINECESEEHSYQPENV